MATLRFVVSGRVQGVFFRASTRAQARKLGLLGSARNLADGRVEVIAQGPDAALGELEAWLRRGPPAANVEGVTREVLVDRDLDGFETG